MRRTLIIGANSAIARATARLFAEEGDALFLVARNEDKLRATAEDLRVRGAGMVFTECCDGLDYDQHPTLINSAIHTLGGLDLVLIAHGTLPDQPACQISFDLIREGFETNALSAISLVTHLANYFESMQQGTIVVITSVAGDRGRQSNYVYGAAKGALSLFLQGLRNRLHKSGVKVITVKPGFVDTPMTASFKKGPLWASPNQIATRICKAITRQENVVYAPWFWRAIMLVIRLIPEALFKRLSL